MFPGKVFENLNTVMVILALLEQFLGKFCLNFLPLVLSASPSVMHFLHTFSIKAYGLLLSKRLETVGKLCSSKTFWKWLVRGCVPSPAPRYHCDIKRL